MADAAESAEGEALCVDDAGSFGVARAAFRDQSERR